MNLRRFLEVGLLVDVCRRDGCGIRHNLRYVYEVLEFVRILKSKLSLILRDALSDSTRHFWLVAGERIRLGTYSRLLKILRALFDEWIRGSAEENFMSRVKVLYAVFVPLLRWEGSVDELIDTILSLRIDLSSSFKQHMTHYRLWSMGLLETPPQHLPSYFYEVKRVGEEGKYAGYKVIMRFPVPLAESDIERVKEIMPNWEEIKWESEKRKGWEDEWEIVIYANAPDEVGIDFEDFGVRI